MVTVCVTTYNSEKYLLETLESIKRQTYEPISLVISDDCSVDRTLAIARTWLCEEVNRQRFISTEIITVPTNTGVSANCNRCIKAADAEWIKFIAGDDILLPNCIEDNMQFALEHPDSSIIFSQVLLYEDEFNEEHFKAAIPDKYPMNLMNPGFTAGDQYKLLLLSDRITYTPSYFFKKQALLEVGCYEEENQLVEDYPMWLKLTRAGNRLYYFHKATVGYRRHQQALNNITNAGLFKPLLLKSAALKKKYVFPYLPWDLVGSEKFVLNVSKIFQQMGMNRNTSFNAALYKIATVYLNPFRYIIFLKKKVFRKGDHNIFYAD